MSLKDSPLPWTVAPLDGKYYGTEIVDAMGNHVCTIWNHDADQEDGHVPSKRERSKFEERTDVEFVEFWKEYCCDSHYESMHDLAIAEAIVAAVNGGARS